MNKHTKGPWKHMDYVWYSSPYSDGYACIHAPKRGRIAMASRRADADLIAAAPDLLEVLRACHGYLSCIPESAAGGDDEAIQLTRRAAAVIAKAEGQA